MSMDKEDDDYEDSYWEYLDAIIDYRKNHMKKKIKLWMEGYNAQGNSDGASYLGEYEGENLLEAYTTYVKEKYKDNIPNYIRKDEPVIWGCRVFDNEGDARKSFG